MNANPLLEHDDDLSRMSMNKLSHFRPLAFLVFGKGEKWLLERIYNPYVFPTTTVWQRIGSESKKLTKKVIQFAHGVPLNIREHMRVDVHRDIDGTTSQNLLHDFWMYPFT